MIQLKQNVIPFSGEGVSGIHFINDDYPKKMLKT